LTQKSTAEARPRNVDYQTGPSNGTRKSYTREKKEEEEEEEKEEEGKGTSDLS
jgi:ribosomal protein L12E/L44/L45/RPP1/RPP2